MQFNSELQINPMPDEEFDRALRAAQEYRRVTDQFDKIICTTFCDGAPLPANNKERALINRNAIEVRNRLIREHDVSGELFHKAIRRINNDAYRQNRYAKGRG